jgi:hypothetical protein
MSLLNGLLHYWDLDTTSWTDSHGSWNLTSRKDAGGSDPSINNTGGPDGGKCLVLDGTNYLDRTDVAWDGSGSARSLQIWARYTSLSATGNWLLNHRGDGVANNLHQLVFSTTSGATRFNCSDGTTLAGAGDDAHASSTWYHILGTTNGTNRHRIYLNGSLGQEVTTALSGILATSQPFAIGAASWLKASTTLRHIGQACMAGIWERELSPLEARQLFNRGSGLRYASLRVRGRSVFGGRIMTRRQFIGPLASSRQIVAPG